MNEDNASLPMKDPGSWQAHHSQVEDAARSARSTVDG
jgi:hypothetical protein